MRFAGFGELVRHMAGERGDKVCLVHGDDAREVTWGAFARDVEVRAGEVVADGPRCVAVFADGSYDCVVEVFSAVCAGAAVLMVDESTPDDLLPELLAAGGADAVWRADAERAARATELLPSGDVSRAAGVRPRDVLFFTSGTTQRSKVVTLSDASLMASAWNGSQLLPLAPEDRLLCMLPLSHVFGFVCGLLWGLSCGATVALGRGPRHYVDDCARFRPTAVSLVPMLVGFLAGHGLFNPELRLVLVGAGDCPRQLLDTVRERGIRVAFGYGLTETSSGVALATGDDPYAMEVCPDDRVAIAEDGEVLVEAPTCMMRGYLGRDDETAEVLVGGVLHTGDLGFLDDEGLLHVTGRKKDVLVLGNGTKVFLPEYEDAIRATLGVSECAVTLRRGRPVLVLAEALGGREKVLGRLSAVLAERPRAHQLCDVVVLGHALPRTQTGKVRRWEIQREVDSL